MISSRRLAPDSHRRLSGRIAEGEAARLSGMRALFLSNKLNIFDNLSKAKSKTFGRVDESSGEVLWAM